MIHNIKKRIMFFHKHNRFNSSGNARIHRYERNILFFYK